METCKTIPVAVVTICITGELLKLFVNYKNVNQDMQENINQTSYENKNKLIYNIICKIGIK